VETPPAKDESVISVSELDGALRLLDLAQQIGAAPDGCHTGIEQQTCSWRLSQEAVTHTFRALDTGPLELRCTLPLDGSARTPDSCATRPLS
jgi:hypothetical protein